ncbi:styrene monooxygenase/indole monooxygenase family protein [Mycolicibacterium thermoresistibile]|uniref:Oxygenase n=2 Tax=Mycolicibacterium thermoresistibile TaxID=1797 RepID=A0A100XGQ2_MYCTH|nr:styrene monooxygenase/indole monooxygenase family protein [Mycolicibacterium thermoresistibile]EHI14827.1 putative oxygenase [Mycolicibacterium thermoresistibile ATCC 19527]MCV7190796.1 FAD-binding oxidoreductase [Mycolicibacterium thermoresistibile]GAT16227.1 oxygenase [Mycolicibacterium thermoresistibile]SNW18635.1 monooxygenase [Mycolicibacterium thermoresistibile]
MAKRSITIVGAGQSGLQLAIGLLAHGYDVRVVSDRTPEEIAASRVASSQAMGAPALSLERGLGLNLWDTEVPPIEGVSMTIAAPPGSGEMMPVRWASRLDAVGQSVDQRVKMPRFIAEFIRRGGEFIVREADVDDLEEYARQSELVIVAAGKGEIAKLFTRDDARSRYRVPQRALALTYVDGMVPRPEYSAICYSVVPGIGEFFCFPALTLSGPCEIMVFEGIIGGPMDCWGEAGTPEQHLDISMRILKDFFPWEAERCENISLTDELGILSGRFPPTVRHPVAVLPSGAEVLGMADVVVLNDPLTGQGSNNASRCAATYLDSICAQDGRPFDREFKQRTFERYWEFAQYSTRWTSAMLEPPAPHAIQLHIAAMEHPEIGRRFANAIVNPEDFFSWYMDPADAEAYLASVMQPSS